MLDPALREDTTTPSSPRDRPANAYTRLRKPPSMTDLSRHSAPLTELIPVAVNHGNNCLPLPKVIENKENTHIENTLSTSLEKLRHLPFLMFRAPT